MYPLIIEKILPHQLIRQFMVEATHQHKVLLRRAALIGILWRESGHTKNSLQPRVEALVGAGCFGRQQTLTFARDIQFIREVLSAAGTRLQYRRSKGMEGYYLEGRPALDPTIEKKITAAINEISAKQAEVQARLTPAKRVWQGAALSDHIVDLAVNRLMERDANLTPQEAQQKVMRRIYQLEQ